MSISLLALVFVRRLLGVHAQSFISTAWQRELLQQTIAQAKYWSAAATSALQERLSSPSVRHTLSTCSVEAAALPTSVLMRRLREAMETVEVVSGFQSTSHESGFNWSYAGMTLDEGLHGLPFFENIWEAGLRANFSFHTDGWFGEMDDVETQFYGLRPFASRGRPSSMNEARERAVYSAVNLHRVDAGSPLYGDVSVVFTYAAMDSMIISAVDTGGWQHLCNNASYEPPPGYSVNCSVFKGSSLLGTLSDYDHLLLANDDYWNGSLGRMLCRLLAPWGKSSLEGIDLVRYWEALPLMRLSYPSAIKFVIGNFPQLFGTLQGLHLQQWCIQNGWMLVWSLGLNLGFDPFFWTAAGARGPFASDQRWADPTVLVHTTAAMNMSLAGDTAKIFNEAWDQAHEIRQYNKTVSNASWASLWIQLKQSLPLKLQLSPLEAGRCSDVHSCIGVSGDGTCVCYRFQQIVV